MTTKRYKILIDDNAHYQDESYRTQGLEFETYDEALTECRRLVDRSLSELLTPTCTADELYNAYTSFGEDPWIERTGDNPRFSAWDYAKQRSYAICGNKTQRTLPFNKASGLTGLALLVFGMVLLLIMLLD